LLLFVPTRKKAQTNTETGTVSNKKKRSYDHSCSVLPQISNDIIRSRAIPNKNDRIASEQLLATHKKTPASCKQMSFRLTYSFRKMRIIKHPENPVCSGNRSRHVKGSPVHVALSCAGCREGSDHFGSYVRSLPLHFCMRLFPGL
jgi:hypothetical protein